jgi:hypothetical protein
MSNQAWEKTAMILKSDEIFRPASQGLVSISVQAGCLWVTSSDDPADYFVRAGETLSFARPKAAGRILIQSVGGETSLSLNN